MIALQTVREEIPASAAAPTPASVPTSAANPPATATSSEASGNDPFYLLRGLGVSAENWYKVEDNCYTFATAIMAGTFVHQEAGVTNIFEESLSRDSVYMVKKDNGVGLICFGNDAVVFASWLPDTDTGNHIVIQDLGGVPSSQFDLVVQMLASTGVFAEYQRLDSYRIIRMVEDLI